MPQDRIEAALLADDLDLGIAFTGHHLPGVAATALFTETLTLVTGAPADVDRVTPLPVRNLTGRQLALLSDDFATRGHIDAYFLRHRAAPRITVEANSIQALTEIVRRTDLATVLPGAITHDHPHLTPVPLEPPLLPAPSLSCTGKAPTSERRPAPSPGSCTTSSTHAAIRPSPDPPGRSRPPDRASCGQARRGRRWGGGAARAPVRRSGDSSCS